VIVFDASTLVSATFRRAGIPAQAAGHALRTDQVAVSEPVLAELLDVLHRPGLAGFIDPDRRLTLVSQLLALGVRFTPTVSVVDCRDAKDNKYLELALASGADRIVSSDGDLLVLHPWRGVRILRAAEYLAEAGDGA
jgi:putative PIN family toxin of toxin-antitoxin system